MTNDEAGARDPRDARREARADAAAEKARAKASRPWFKKKRFVIPLGLLLLVVLGSALAGGGNDTDTSDGGSTVGTDEPQSPEQSDEPELTAIGTPARDGKFEFTVNSFECGETTVGQEFFEEQAQGQFCLLNVRVQNIGSERQFLSADNQKLLDEAGTVYSPSSSATFAIDPEGNTLFEDINPGNAVEGTIVFDVPQDAQITRAELHDSAFSGGVVVNLR